MNTLNKVEHLCSKRVIETLFKSGESMFRHPFKVIYVQNNQDFNRVLISVPKRSFKKAVTRNLIRRRIRESYRLNKSNITFNKYYDIIILYVSNDILEYSAINGKIRDCLEKIGKVD